MFQKTLSQTAVLMLRVKSISMCTCPGRCAPTCYFYSKLSKPIVSTRFWFVNPKPKTWKLPPEIYRFRRHLQTMVLRISSRNIYRTISSRKSRTSTRKIPPKPRKISCVLLEIRWHLQDIPRISNDNSKTPDVPTWQKTLPGAFSAPAAVNGMRLRSLKQYWGKNTIFEGTWRV